MTRTRPRLLATAIVLFVACRGEPPPPTVPDTAPLPFDQSPSPVIQLDRAAADLSLPASNEPQGTPAPHSFELTEFTVTPDWGESDMTLITARAPFTNGGKQAKRFSPEGLRVTVDGKTVAHSNRLSERRSSSHYALEGARIELVLATAPTSVRIEHAGLKAHSDRLEHTRSGLTDDQYVRYTHHINDRSRSGLLLPAPTTAAWSVTVPDDGRFETWTAIVPTQRRDAESDGVKASLVAVVDGVDTIISSHELTVQPSYFSNDDGGGFTRWTADLSSLAGKSITLKLITETGPSGDWDYAFFASPVVTTTPKTPPRRVIVIGLDTTRPDHLGVYGYERPTTPELDDWAKTASVFDAAWAPAPRTRPAFRTATTGRYPLDAVGARNIGDVFDEAGFATAGIVANIHLNRRFGFHSGFDEWTLDPEAKASDQVDDALAWLTANRHRDTYLFMHIMDPHIFYAAPEPYGSMFVDSPDPDLGTYNRWMVKKWALSGKLTKQRQDHIVGSYDGEVRYTDRELKRFFDGLGKLGGNDLVVIHSDHGEEFWEHGGFEHNHQLYDETTRVVLLIDPPPGQTATSRLSEPVWLADIGPTLFDYAGISSPPKSDGRSLKALIDASDAGDWKRPIPIAHLMYDTERWGVAMEGHKYIVHTISGEEELYDLAADPAESKNLASTTDTSRFWKGLGAAHNMPVGPGWRIDLTLKTDLVITLPAPAAAAGVFDPEAALKKRANLAWGESAAISPKDVAIVTLSDDGSSVRIEKGKSGRGTLWIRFSDPQPIQATIREADTDAELAQLDETHRKWAFRGNNLYFKSGIVFQTPAGEAVRMGTAKSASEGQTCELCALGYLSGPSCEACESE